MSRRDTIIISVLINAGLLAILFATAWNSDDDQLSNSLEDNRVMAEVQQGVQQQSQPSAIGIDEVDKVLHQHALAQKGQDVTSLVAPPLPIMSSAPTAYSQGVASSVDCVEVTVKRGDYLDKIAHANGTTVEAIVKANDLVDTRLQIGQVLRVPKSDLGSIKTQNATTEVASADFDVYVVKRGDNPWTIARDRNVKLEELLRVNKLDDGKARSLRVGDKLKIPNTGRG